MLLWCVPVSDTFDHSSRTVETNAKTMITMGATKPMRLVIMLKAGALKLSGQFLKHMAERLSYLNVKKFGIRGAVDEGHERAIAITELFLRRNQEARNGYLITIYRLMAINARVNNVAPDAIQNGVRPTIKVHAIFAPPLGRFLIEVGCKNAYGIENT